MGIAAPRRYTMRAASLMLVLFSSTVVQSQLTSCGAATAGPVLNGVDIVATFTQAKAGTPTEPPVMGSAEYNFTDSEGFTFHFSSAANAASYSASPSSYPVGAGGYCGLAVSGGDPACGYQVCEGGACLSSASTYKLASDGKLYFFLGPGAENIFSSDEAKNAAGCTANIAAVQNKTGTTCWNTDKFNCHGGGPPGPSPGPGPAPGTCQNLCDNHPRPCGGQTCEELTQKYPCDKYYCDNCTYAGWCDKTCGTGACAKPPPPPTVTDLLLNRWRI